jgi:hypothetical protein
VQGRNHETFLHDQSVFNRLYGHDDGLPLAFETTADEEADIEEIPLFTQPVEPPDVYPQETPTDQTPMPDYSDPSIINFLDEHCLRAVNDTVAQNFTYKTAAMTVFFAIVAAFAARTLWTWFSPDGFEETSRLVKEPEVTLKRTYQKGHKPRYDRWKRVPKFHPTMSEPKKDQVYDQAKNWVGHLVGVGFDDKGNRQNGGCITMRIKDRWFTAPSHFFQKFASCEELKFQFTWGTHVTTFVLGDGDVITVDEFDMVLFKMPMCVPSLPPQLYNKIWHNEKDLLVDLPAGTPVSMITLNTDAQTLIKHMNVVSDKKSIAYRSEGLWYVIHSPIKYNAVSVPGDSGAPIVTRGPQGQLSIVGIQCGNTTKAPLYSIAQSLNRQVFDGFLAEAEGSPHVEEADGIEESPIEVTNSAFPFDHVIADVPCNVNRFSKIKKSPMYGYMGRPQYVPARMRPSAMPDGTVSDPLFVGISKMTQKEFGPTIVDPRVHSYLDKYYGWDKNPRLLDWDECLNGSTEYNYPAIEYSTSPGYPYNLARKAGKSPYIERNPDGHMSYSPEFFKQVVDYEQQLISGDPGVVYWADFMKDETRPIEKVRENKTRIVSACPLHFLVVLRKYFQAFVSHVQARAHIAPISVGLNVHSREHFMLYDRLSRTAGSVIAGDFKAYDGLIPTTVDEEAVNYVNRWYDDGPTNCLVRKMLYVHICTATHICGPYVYKVAGGNPSGNPITSIHNSLTNIFMCFTILVQRLKIAVEDFEIAVYGDDNLITVVRPGLRVSDFSPHFKEMYGMTYTHFSKAENEDYDDLSTVQYLGRSFRFEKGLCRAPLDLSVIRESIYWFKSDAERDLILLSVLDSMAIEFSHHGEAVFNEEMEIVFQELKVRVPHLYHSARLRAKAYFQILDGMYYA